ncbi:MAG: hypothetical protein WCJ13_04435 [Coriobacteriia bacterium]
MTRTLPAHRYTVLAVVLAMALLLGGCAGQRPKPSVVPTPTASSSVAIARMSAEQKRTTIATSFPIEVPVPQGRVVRGEAQGADAWDYQLMIPASAADVVSWYAEWYTKADWQLISDTAADGGRKLSFVKGGAESAVIVKPAGADLTSVIVVLGVGAPVLNTQ